MIFPIICILSAFAIQVNCVFVHQEQLSSIPFKFSVFGIDILSNYGCNVQQPICSVASNRLLVIHNINDIDHDNDYNNSCHDNGCRRCMKTKTKRQFPSKPMILFGIFFFNFNQQQSDDFIWKHHKLTNKREKKKIKTI